MVALAQLRVAGEEDDAYSSAMQEGLLDSAEANLDRRDHGICEMRGDLHWRMRHCSCPTSASARTTTHGCAAGDRERRRLTGGSWQY